jgi:hypothetical protein
MPKFLVIGISTENDLFVSSDEFELKNSSDEKKAARLISKYMEVEVDRVLIVQNQRVVNDFIP